MKRLGHGLSAALWLSLVAGPAEGVEVGAVDGETIRVEVTDASSVSYNVDNRNTRPVDVTRSADDDWGLWQNRLNLQGSWRHWQAGLRLDSAVFYAAPATTDVALELLRQDYGGRLPDAYGDAEAERFVQYLRQSDAELSNKFVSWLYPAKYYAGYATPDVEITAGDFYAQLGRGLVLSVRKLDELSSDTTVRGGRVTGRLRLDGYRLKLTALGGVMNPLRVDEASGRYLAVDDRVARDVAVVTEAGMPRPIDRAFDPDPFPTYAPDRLIGAQIEGGAKQAQVAVQGSLLDRTLLDVSGDGTADEALSPGAVRSAEQIATGSVSGNLPSLGGHGAAYLEAAVQDHVYPASLRAVDDARPEAERFLPQTGYAIYGSVNATGGPLALTVEGRHYRRFFPLQANVDIGAAREFSPVQYSAPPTTEAFWVDTELESFNTCVSGGRAKADTEVGANESVFVWVGHYLTWAESIANERCRTDDTNLNRVWDLASGLEVTSQRRKSRASAVVGARVDDTDRAIEDSASGAATHVFYREVYARYDVTRWLGGPLSLQLQGWHRRRRQTLGGPDDRYFQGQHLTALQWAPHFTFGFGVEYDTSPLFPDTYLNGLIRYNIDSSSNVSVFAGQRRGGLRCVSGVCRVFPPFEGVRADATFRF